MPVRMQQCDSVIFMLALNVLTACRCEAIWNIACELCYANIFMPAHTLSHGAAGRALSYIVCRDCWLFFLQWMRRDFLRPRNIASYRIYL